MMCIEKRIRIISTVSDESYGVLAVVQRSSVNRRSRCVGGEAAGIVLGWHAQDGGRSHPPRCRRSESHSEV
jgi:hypothetical protein